MLTEEFIKARKEALKVEKEIRQKSSELIKKRKQLNKELMALKKEIKAETQNNRAVLKPYRNTQMKISREIGQKIKQICDIKTHLNYATCNFTVYKNKINVTYYDTKWKRHTFSISTYDFDHRFEELLEEYKAEAL